MHLRLGFHCPFRRDPYGKTRPRKRDSPVALMATKNAFVLRAFITGIVCIVMVGLGWLSDPLTAGDQTGAISRLVAWFSLAAATIALIIAIYFTWRALTIREPQKESDLEFEGDGSRENPDPNR